MRRTRASEESAQQGGELELTEDVEWEKMWGCRSGVVLRETLFPHWRDLGRFAPFFLFALVCHASPDQSQEKRRTYIITVTDNAPQGLNSSLFFPLARSHFSHAFHPPWNDGLSKLGLSTLPRRP